MGKKKAGGKARGQLAAAQLAAAAEEERQRRQRHERVVDGLVAALRPADERPRAAEPLLGDGAGMIFAVRGMLGRKECRAALEAARALELERVGHAATREFAFRDNYRRMVRHPALAEALWQRLRPLVPPAVDGRSACGLNPAMRFYHYEAGQAFGQHVDESAVDPDTGWASRFTVLVYLNDARDSGLQGGRTIFYAGGEEPALAVAPETGMALVHGHGERCLLHEGERVSAGVKVILRTDVMYA